MKPLGCPSCDGPARPGRCGSSFWECSGCGLLFRHPVPTEEELERLYTRSWSEPEGHRAETGGMDDRLAGVYARRLAQSLGRSDLAGLRVLEFGAGRGDLLRAMRDLGAHACGIEPFGKEFLKVQGLEVYGSIEELSETSSFDGVVSLDVVEHLRAPWTAVAALRRKLREGGWLHLSTPNSAGLRARFKRDRWEEALKPGHLFLFSPRSMETLLRRAGYASSRRLRWFVDYGRSPVRWLAGGLLQAVGLDGSLRYMAWSWTEPRPRS